MAFLKLFLHRFYAVPAEISCDLYLNYNAGTLMYTTILCKNVQLLPKKITAQGGGPKIRKMKHRTESEDEVIKRASELLTHQLKAGTYSGF